MPALSHLFSTVLADTRQQQPQGGGEMMLIMILMFVIFYFVLIRPQRKRQKELEARIAALKKGDKIVTAGGIHGMVTNVKNTTVMVAVADGVKLEVEKGSISSTAPKEAKENAEAEEEDKAPASDEPGKKDARADKSK